MRLRITTPVFVIVDEDAVTSVRAEDETGGFGIQEGHADFLTSLVPSVVRWRGRGEGARYCAVRSGVLTVSGGALVSVAVRDAVRGDDFRTLGEDVLARFRSDEDTEKVERVESGKLQLTAIRQIVRNLQRDGSRGGGADVAAAGEQEESDERFVEEVRRRHRRDERWHLEGEDSVARRLAQIGVLGWIIVTPALAGMFAGRWLDQRLGTGVFWTAPLLLVGLGLGAFSAWRWIRAA